MWVLLAPYRWWHIRITAYKEEIEQEKAREENIKKYRAKKGKIR